MQVYFTLKRSSVAKQESKCVIIIIAFLQNVCVFSTEVGITDCSQRVHLGYCSDVRCSFADYIIAI